VLGGGVLGFFKLPCALVVVVSVHVVSLLPAVVVLVVVHVFVAFSQVPSSVFSQYTCDDDAARAPVVPKANTDSDPSNINGAVRDMGYSSLGCYRTVLILNSGAAYLDDISFDIGGSVSAWSPLSSISGQLNKRLGATTPSLQRHRQTGAHRLLNPAEPSRQSTSGAVEVKFPSVLPRNGRA
jgi:hypothetical protein